MTEIDTSTEAVGRLAEYLSSDVARTLRALAAERDALKQELDDLEDGLTIAHLSGAERMRKRKDAEANALVAAAYEAAQVLSQCTWATMRVCGQYVDRKDLVDRLSALTPDDARAALDQMLAEAEARGVEKERGRCARLASDYGSGNSYAAKMIAAAIREGEG